MLFLLKSFKLFYFLCLRDSGNEGSSFCTLIHKIVFANDVTNCRYDQESLLYLLGQVGPLNLHPRRLPDLLAAHC